jgi:hypothetical protein
VVWTLSPTNQPTNQLTGVNSTQNPKNGAWLKKRAKTLFWATLLILMVYSPFHLVAQTLPSNFKAIWYQNSSASDNTDTIPDLFMLESNESIIQKVKALGRNTIFMNNIESKMANHLL